MIWRGLVDREVRTCCGSGVGEILYNELKTETAWYVPRTRKT